MRGFQRGLRSIRHYWKRNLLLFFSFLLMAVLFLGIASLRQNVEDAIGILGERIGAELVVRKASAQPFSYYSESFFPLKAAEEMMAKQEGIQSLQYLTMSNVEGDGVEGVPEYYVKMSMQGASAEGYDFWEDYETSGLGEARTAGSITLMGVDSLEDAWEFRKWDTYLVEGQGITEEDGDRPIAVVSERFLKWNFLELGDEITLRNPVNKEETITLTIVGVHSGDYETNLIAFSPMNYIYIPAKQGLAFSKGEVFEVYCRTDQPQDIRSIREDVQSDMQQITGQEFLVREEKLIWLVAASPMEGVQTFCSTLLFAIGFIILLILFLVTMRILLERKREFAVWLAMGEQKSCIMMQMGMELLLPIMGGTAAGTVLVALAEKQLGNLMVRMLPSFEGIAFRISPLLALFVLVTVLAAEGLLILLILARWLRKAPMAMLKGA